MLTYHGDLSRQNIYTRPFDDFCPPQRDFVRPRDAEQGYDQALAIPCLNYSFDESRQMTVKLVYSAEAETRWRMRTFAVTQRLLEWSEKDGWSEAEQL